VTGLSRHASPGSIVKLSPATTPPSASVCGSRAAGRGTLLARCGVHDFDGYTWRRTPGVFHLRQRLQYLGTPTATAWRWNRPRQRWWFALDTPAQSPDTNVLLTYDNRCSAASRFTEPVSFDAVSYTRTTRAGAAGASAAQQARPPCRGNESRSVALAQTLRAARRLRCRLRGRRLWSTCAPVASSTPSHRASRRPVDDLLFNTRAGFCGHYASAFVHADCARGRPGSVGDRLFGGEWNPIGGYFVVRQADAHAWAEVWLEGRGWNAHRSDRVGRARAAAAAGSSTCCPMRWRPRACCALRLAHAAAAARDGRQRLVERSRREVRLFRAARSARAASDPLRRRA